MDTREAVLRFLPDRVNQRNDLIVTPPRIAEDMINILPDDVWNSSTKFLDPMCKDGIFLYKIYVKLMASESLIAEFPDEMERKDHILHHQLYGVSPERLCQLMTIRTVYGTLNTESNIKLAKSTNISDIRSVIEKEFNGMQFDVVAGNPPYNNDAYLDFVTMGHLLARKYDLWITPAKWQAKGGQKNEDFRANIVPYMSKIVYYPDSADMFDIAVHGGISYYLMDKSIHNIKCIKNGMVIYTNDEVRKLNNNLWNIGDNIVTKINISKQLDIFDIQAEKNCYKCTLGKKIIRSGSGHKDLKGKFTCDYSTLHNCIVLSDVGIEDSNYENRLGDSVAIYYGSKEQCNYFRSYINSKFVRFLVLMSIHGVGIYDRETWRFVPDPGAFDHIFTDQELYKKYNLTDEEINIIESVIKERK